MRAQKGSKISVIVGQSTGAFSAHGGTSCRAHRGVLATPSKLIGNFSSGHHLRAAKVKRLHNEGLKSAVAV